MRSRITVYTAKLCFLKPWRLVADNLGVNHLGYVASDGVVGQCRRILFLSADLTVRYQSQFDQCLESVADTKSKTVTLIEELHNCLLDLLVLERGSKEFRGSIRLISG